MESFKQRDLKLALEFKILIWFRLLQLYKWI
jgi:hypothetical protein